MKRVIIEHKYQGSEDGPICRFYSTRTRTVYEHIRTVFQKYMQCLTVKKRHCMCASSSVESWQRRPHQSPKLKKEDYQRIETFYVVILVFCSILKPLCPPPKKNIKAYTELCEIACFHIKLYSRLQLFYRLVNGKYDLFCITFI